MKFYIVLFFITLLRSCPCVPEDFKYHNIFHTSHSSNGYKEYNGDKNTELPHSDEKSKEYDDSVVVFPTNRPRFYESNGSTKSVYSSHNSETGPATDGTEIIEFDCIQKEGKFTCHFPVQSIYEMITHIFQNLHKNEKGNVEGSGISDLSFDDEDMYI